MVHLSFQGRGRRLEVVGGDQQTGYQRVVCGQLDAVLQKDPPTLLAMVSDAILVPPLVSDASIPTSAARNELPLTFTSSWTVAAQQVSVHEVGQPVAPGHPVSVLQSLVEQRSSIFDPRLQRVPTSMSFTAAAPA
jgi:hypothetical protein